MTSINRELAGKRLELLRNFAPRASRVAILWDERNSGNRLGMDDAEAAAKTLGLTIRSVPMRSPEALDRDGPVLIEVPRYRRGPEAMTDARVVERPTALRHFSVTAMRIDSLNLSRLDFMKMDVEGHELQAVRGGLETITRFRPAMVIESVFAQGDWLYPILEPLGYRGFVWHAGAFRLTSPSERSQNVFFLMPHHVAPRDSA